MNSIRLRFWIPQELLGQVRMDLLADLAQFELVLRSPDCQFANKFIFRLTGRDGLSLTALSTVSSSALSSSRTDSS
jgi:hypothetical protein